MKRDCMTKRYVVAIILFAGFTMSALTGCGATTGNGERVLTAYLSANRSKVDEAISVDTTAIPFVVEPGTPARGVGENLVAAGLIQDDLLFEAYVRVNNLAEKLEAGTFMLAPSMTMAEIVEKLQDAQAKSIAITIPEGWRLEQVAEYLGEANVFADYDLSADVPGAEVYRDEAISGNLEGVDLAKYPFLQDRPEGASLEGFLFPDTYEVPAVGTLPADVFSRQLDNFAAKVIPAYEEAVAAGTTDMDLYHVLTLASIVEREAVIPEERPDIARVYLNRLSNGIALEADPTVQYAMGYQEDSGQWWKTPVFLEEYSSVDSPYNTYLNAGMPPGPIASPGLSSIRAVLNPADNDYLYFVAVPDGTGAHVFAPTWEEHLANVAAYEARP
jgi:UPF0755 protein